MPNADDLIFELKEALKEAIGCIRVFHGKPGWDIYEKNAPEIQRFKRILAKVRDAER